MNRGSGKAINAFARIFTQSELHPFRQRKYGEQALLIYQTRARREWHDQKNKQELQYRSSKRQPHPKLLQGGPR